MMTVGWRRILSDSPFSTEPPIARWELWSVATMLVATHGSEAEAVASDRLNNALALGDEAYEIVWKGVLTQLAKIRAAE